MTIPKFGLGTFRLTGDTVKHSVKTALEEGYRVIDTAQIYGNDAEIGEVIAESGIARSELFITTKIWVDNLGKDRLIPSLKESLAKLRTDYVDLTLIHWPSNNIDLAESLGELMQAKAQGLTRAIGVSNFTVELMQQAVDSVGADNIATNQIELSPFLQNRTVVEAAQKLGIPVTSYMTLAYGKALQDDTITRIAAKHQATAAQVILAWALALGYAVIPSSTKRENLRSNLAAQTLKLDADDMAAIAALERGERLVNPDGLAPVWDKA